jgi:hypothetical protein
MQKCWGAHAHPNLCALNLFQYAPNPVEWIDPWGWIGRRGNQATKNHMDNTRNRFTTDNAGAGHRAGGRDAVTGAEQPETYLPPIGNNAGRRCGGSYTDMTFDDAQGRTVYIQTVDPGPMNGMNQREWNNAQRIQQQNPSAIIITVPKNTVPKPGDLDTANLQPSQMRHL